MRTTSPNAYMRQAVRIRFQTVSCTLFSMRANTFRLSQAMGFLFRKFVFLHAVPTQFATYQAMA